MTPWNGAAPPADPPITAAGWLRIAWRGAVLGIVTFGCLGLLLLVRLVERPIFGWHRPVTPFITQFVCRMAFVILGIRYRVQGRQMRARGAVVANHASWLDIFTLNARKRVYFVSKAEVASWPGIGWLARATGTLFINRDRREAKAHANLFEERLKAGHKLLFFPEGTSTDGRRVLPFKTTLFAAFLTPGLRDILHIQPVTVVYTAPSGQHPAFYGWWGEMGFGAHLLKVLAAKPQGGVEVIYHTPLRVADFPDRKALAKACEEAVRSALPG
ncbi:lysophospholipid acyltransferase family protein [Rhodovulum adriaticum]|uniref:Lyso-ornithine lipid acyltransferase n=1 Tax=Rhodovulum adriaticum TaxID=35804 RepID=A0A4V2SM73_RHOAD|nr:lysophospholipid acyltransferase family protein [Rhodovulum adriaticum]MBK1635638.1 1-acyl-sn-glycerol-3-phosphate acyltransferase [Rhodovulum adriaticum]TCP26126.1 lyso-ornithine lipid acyltransferase [Rhodovulum adriaticum]